MSLRELIDPECGGANPLMRLGNQIVRDAAHKDEGISGRPMPFAEASSRSQQGFSQSSQDQLVNEFLGQMSAPPPQTFRMDALLQEMREIDAHNYPVEVVQAPSISHEVKNGLTWANEFDSNAPNVGASKNADQQVSVAFSIREQFPNFNGKMYSIISHHLCISFLVIWVVLAKSTSSNQSITTSI